MSNVVHNQFSIAKIRSLKDAGRYVDGGGLYLRGDKLRGKAWFLRVSVGGRRREMSLGSELGLDPSSRARMGKKVIRASVVQEDNEYLT